MSNGFICLSDAQISKQNIQKLKANRFFLLEYKCAMDKFREEKVNRRIELSKISC